MKQLLKSAAVIGVVALSFSTTLVQAEPTVSLSAQAVAQTPVEESWTWTDFGGQVVGWAAGGAAGGAVTAAMIGSPVGAACGAAVGGVSGAVSGAAYYAGTQAWDALFGDSTQQNLNMIAPAVALD